MSAVPPCLPRPLLAATLLFAQSLAAGPAAPSGPAAASEPTPAATLAFIERELLAQGTQRTIKGEPVIYHGLRPVVLAERPMGCRLRLERSRDGRRGSFEADVASFGPVQRHRLHYTLAHGVQVKGAWRYDPDATGAAEPQARGGVLLRADGPLRAERLRLAVEHLKQACAQALPDTFTRSAASRSTDPIVANEATAEMASEAGDPALTDG
ncbi:MAG: hypothetical protein AAF515_21385 [Pseudomonadota bacterium]